VVVGAVGIDRMRASIAAETFAYDKITIPMGQIDQIRSAFLAISKDMRADMLTLDDAENEAIKKRLAANRALIDRLRTALDAAIAVRRWRS
jgi:GH18 family chitinase